MNRLLAVLFVATSLTATAQAPEPPLYSVLSLVGDKLEIVTGPGKKTAEPVADAQYDNQVAQAFGDALREEQPKSKISQLNTRSAVLFENQNTFFAEKDGVVTMPQALKDAFAQQKATYVLLVTKHHAESGDLGAGKLEGLGLIADEVGGGRVVGYAYLRLTLLDAKTMQVLARQDITAAQGVSGARALSQIAPKDRARQINFLITRDVTKATPKLVKGR